MKNRITINSFLSFDKECNAYIEHCLQFQKIAKNASCGSFEPEDLRSEVLTAIVEFFHKKGGWVKFPFTIDDLKEVTSMVNRRLRAILALEAVVTIPGDYLRRDVNKLSSLNEETKEAIKKAKAGYVPLFVESGDQPSSLTIEERFTSEESRREHSYFSHLDFEDENLSVAESQVLYETFGYGDTLNSDVALALFKVFEGITNQEKEAFRLYEEGYSEKEAGAKVGLNEKWLYRLKGLIKKAIKEN